MRISLNFLPHDGNFLLECEDSVSPLSVFNVEALRSVLAFIRTLTLNFIDSSLVPFPLREWIVTWAKDLLTSLFSGACRMHPLCFNIALLKDEHFI